MPQKLDVMSPEETLSLIHELQVHVIELETRNEELRRGQARQFLLTEVLRILNHRSSLADAIRDILNVIKRETGFDAVGIRLRSSDDFPYFFQDGFSADFMLTENTLTVRNQDGVLCRDEDGSYSMECTCGLVISGQTDPTNPLFTPGGSFWTNNSLPLLDLPAARNPKLHPRNRCIREGYLSIALIPLRMNQEIMGLLQLNSRKKDCFSLETISFFEEICTSIARALLRKLAEETLRKLTRAVEQSPATVVVTDLQGNIEYVNPQFTLITGYTPEEALGKNPRILKSGRQTTAYYQELWSTITSGNIWRGEFQNKRKDGGVFWERASISPIHNEMGEITNFVAVKEDITKNKQAEALLREATERASELAIKADMANKAKSDFLANMSHEIRTPMNGVIGMTGLLLDTELTADQRKYANIVRVSGESLLRLINDILDFSKMEASKLELESMDFDLRSMLDDFAAITAMRAKDKGLAFTCAAAPDVPTFLCGDPGRLRQVLINLTGNAVKFTAKGEIAVRASLMSETDQSALIRFSVKDTGIGVPAQKKGLLFQKFIQLDASITRHYGGTGLGLAISKQLAEMMGGQIGVESEEGRGSEFWFTARFAKQAVRECSSETTAEISRVHVLGDKNEPRAAQSPVTLHAGRELRREEVRILLAEDDISNQMVALGILNKFGLRADAVADGAQAISALETNPYDLVLMDVQMPEIDGLSATRIIRDPQSAVRNHHIPVIAMTAYAMKGDREKCLAAGMNDYVSKPVDPQALADVLEKWLPQDKAGK